MTAPSPGTAPTPASTPPSCMREADLPPANAGSHSSVMALLEDTLAGAARARVGSDRAVVAVDLNFAFVAPAQGRIRATATVVGGGRSMCFCEGQASDASGAVVARAMGTFRAQAAA